MKRALIVTLLLLSVTAAGARDISPDFRNEKKHFCVASSFLTSYVGYTSKESHDGTMYLDFTVSPDYRFARHWGVLADLGFGFAFTGNGATGDHHTVQAKLFAAPYFEQQFSRWYFDIMAGGFIRARQPFYGPTTSRVGATVCAGPAVGLRSGVFVNNFIDIFGTFRLEGTMFDPMESFAEPYMTDHRAGNMVFGIGIRFKIKSR